MAAISAQTIINNALVNIGVLDQGGTPSVSDSNESLTRLNYMLGQWRIQRRFVYEVALAQYLLVANTGSYPIGPSAAAPFNVVRPNFLVRAYFAVTLAPSAKVITSPLDMLTAEEYNNLADLSATAEMSQKIYYDHSSPNGTINLYPIPRCNAVSYIQLLTWVQITNFANLAGTTELPDGYPEAITNALALRLCSMFGIAGPTFDLCSALAKQAEEAITALNAEVLGFTGDVQPAQPEGN